MKSALSELVNELAASGVVSAVSAVIGDGKRPLAESHAGWADAQQTRPLAARHRFDLASLTKPWTATLAAVLDRKGSLPLALKVGEIWPDAPGRLARQPLEGLLRHRSGMLAWRPLYRHLRHPRRVVDRLLREDSIGAPKPTYSDLGYILWARGAEVVTGVPLPALLGRHVLRPLGLSTVEVEPDPGRSVASLMGNAREIELAADLGVRVGRLSGPPRGVAQDGNARFLGGFPGHAGLFAPARALWRLGAEWLEPTRVLGAGSVVEALEGTGRYRLAWWRHNAVPRATRPLSAESFGHHGFTGSSLWIDPRRNRVAVLLAHRVAGDVDLDPWRRRFHQLAVA